MDIQKNIRKHSENRKAPVNSSTKRKLPENTKERNIINDIKNIKEAAYADRKYTETGIPKTGF